MSFSQSNLEGFFTQKVMLFSLFFYHGLAQFVIWLLKKKKSFSLLTLLLKFISLHMTCPFSSLRPVWSLGLLYIMVPTLKTYQHSSIVAFYFWVINCIMEKNLSPPRATEGCNLSILYRHSSEYLRMSHRGIRPFLWLKVEAGTAYSWQTPHALLNTTSKWV